MKRPGPRSCGHPGTGECLFCRGLYRAINKQSRYWFARLILGWSEPEASAFKTQTTVERWRLHHRCQERGRRRRLAEQLRAQGYTGYRLSARIRGGVTAAQERARQRKQKRELRVRWGGNPIAGSPAWQRRERARYFRKIERPDLAKEVEQEALCQ